MFCCLTHVNLHSWLKQTSNVALALFTDTISAGANLCSVCFLCENKSSLWLVSGHSKVSDGTRA